MDCRKLPLVRKTSARRHDLPLLRCSEFDARPGPERAPHTGRDLSHQMLELQLDTSRVQLRVRHLRRQQHTHH